MQCQHNLAAIDELLAPDFVDHGSPDAVGRGAACVFFSMMFAAFPDMRFTIRVQIAEGDKVLTYKTFHGTHLGPFNGIPPTGRAVDVDVMDILTVANGQNRGALDRGGLSEHDAATRRRLMLRPIAVRFPPTRVRFGWRSLLALFWHLCRNLDARSDQQESHLLTLERSSP